MKVFISWSGDYSRQLAAAIHWWLPKVLSVENVYFSDIDIEAGSRWYHSIVDALEASDAGLVILTPENITRQWIMFEAGAIARSVAQGRVCPILFGGIKKSDPRGPLSFFQAVEFTEDDFRKLQKAINNGKLGEEDLAERFDAWWDKLKAKIANIKPALQPALKEPDDKEVLREILALARAILTEFEKLPPWQRMFVPADVAVQRNLGFGPGATVLSGQSRGLLDTPPGEAPRDGTVAKSAG